MDWKLSMKKVASTSSAAATTKITVGAIREGNTLSLATPADATRQFFSFARAVAVSVTIRYVAMMACNSCTLSASLNLPRMRWVHVDLYRPGRVDGLIGFETKLPALLFGVFDPITYYDTGVGIDAAEMLKRNVNRWKCGDFKQLFIARQLTRSTQLLPEGIRHF
jgi:hypothetical protein